MPVRVAVVGLGGVGSQVAWQLAQRGARVVGFDRERPPHELGSSHGESRIIREAYAEGPQYVPLVRRAWEMWEQLGARAGHALLHPCGGVHLGRAGGAYLTRLRAVADRYDIPLTDLGAAAPAGFARNPELVTVRERRAGWIEPENAVRIALGLAADNGAELRIGEPVLAIGRGRDGCGIETAHGTETVDRVVVCAGAWTAELLPEAAAMLELERQVIAWFDPPARPPATIWFAEYAPEHYVYGFPPDRFGLKAAIHHDGRTVTLDRLQRRVDESELDVVRDAASSVLGDDLGAARRSRVCLYTNTPDRHFAVGPLPGEERIVLVSACSGHGFKFAPALGEGAAALALGESPPVDLSAFSPARFGARG